MRVWPLALLLFSGIAHSADVPAVLQWSGRVEIGPRVSGIVKTVHAKVGDRVKKGQILLVLDNQIYQARTAAAAAVVARRELELSDAKLNLTRIQELYDRTVSSTSELDEAKLKMGRAESALKEARAELAIHSKNVSDSLVRAPFDAQVVSRLAEPGQNVVVNTSPQPVFVLARSDGMIARANLSSAQVKGLKLGQSLEVGIANQSHSGRVSNIVYDPNKEGVVLEIQLPLTDSSPAGTPAVIRLP